MFGAMVLKVLPLFTSIIECQVKFVVEEGVLKAVGDVQDDEWVRMQNVNDFASIDKESFEKLMSVKKLSIKNCNRIPLVFNWICKHMKELVGLGLNGNCLRSIPDSIGNLASLTELYLSNNKLISLPDSIGNLKSLTKLLLYSNKLKSLPDSIGKLPNLKELDLRNNKLKSLSKSIESLTNLTKLDLSYNKLKSLPKYIGCLVNLKELHLDYNELTLLPDFIRNLINLTELDLSYNQLRSLPNSIESLVKLEELFLSFNELQSLPNSIESLANLKELLLYNNKLTTLPDSFGNLKSLLNVNLSNNQLTSLPKSFRNLSQLILLNLRGNSVQHTPVQGLGRIDLQRIFGDRVLFSGITNSSSVEISKEDVYKKLKEKDLCWNFDKLNEFRHEGVQKTNLDKDRMIVAVNSLAEKGKLDALDRTVLVEYIEKLHDPDREYNRWPMLPEYVELTKNLLGCILERMSQTDCNFDLAIIAEAVRYCPDRQMGDLRQAYHFVMEQNVPQDILEDFVKTHIASEKEVLFDLAITPVQSTQNVHVLNHWRHKLGDELGFDTSFITKIGTQGQDPFHDSDGNALDVFFSVFTPEYVIKTLTEAINERKPVMCELAMKIYNDDNLTDDQKVEMFTFEESIQNAKIESMMDGYFKGLTQKAVEYYLIKEGIVISKIEDNEPFEISNDTQSKRMFEDNSTDSNKKRPRSDSNPHAESSITPPILDGYD